MSTNVVYKTNLASSLQEILSTTKHPLLITDIINLLGQKNLVCNKTSIYRQLEKMITNQKISQINTLHGTAWELKQTLNHAHIICDECETIKCVSIQEKQVNSITQQINNFNITKITLNGICKNCT